ncbi:peptidyl-tRNA hydrolase PTH2 domain-containing protein [Ditylenchus destructor]|nr:peptidyl-tRNA hydrolase PTH2 domain-containing protein [Ditylenchus destructor]
MSRHPLPESSNQNRGNAADENETPPPPLPPPPPALDDLDEFNFNPPEPVSSNSSSNRVAAVPENQPVGLPQNFDPVSSSSFSAPSAPTSSGLEISDPAVHSLSFFNNSQNHHLPTAQAQLADENLVDITDPVSGGESTPQSPLPSCSSHNNFAGRARNSQLGGSSASPGVDIPLEPQSQADEFVSSTTFSQPQNPFGVPAAIQPPISLSNTNSQQNNYVPISLNAVPESTTSATNSQTASTSTALTPATNPLLSAACSGTLGESSSSNQPSSSSLQLSHPSDPSKFNVDRLLLEQVLEFGFEEFIATLAIQRTGGAGLEQAVNWIIDHSNQSDLENDSGQEDEDITDLDVPEQMGASTSKAAAVSLKLITSDTSATNSAALADVIRSIRPPKKRSHKMIFVANMSLKMGVGKLAAQVGHATLGVYRVAQKSSDGAEALTSWRNHGEVKIVVKGQSTEQLLDLFKQSKDLGLYAYLVQDAGYTQIPPGSRTVLGIFGEQQTVDKITGSLKLL